MVQHPAGRPRLVGQRRRLTRAGVLRLGAVVIGAALLLAILFAGRGGAAAVWQSGRLVGPGGFAAVVGVHALLMGLMGAAWWRLEGSLPRRWPLFAWGRMIRDSAAELLPLSQLGGYVLGARAATLAGVPGVFAAASTVVDVTVELAAQLVYTGIGLALLHQLRPGAGFVAPGLAAIGAMAGLVALFVLAQGRGAWSAGQGLVRRMLARTVLGRLPDTAGQIQAAIVALHGRRLALATAFAIHLLAWLLNGVETWLTLRLMQLPPTLPEALVIDSLLYGLRSVAFAVPGALGVQEAGLVLLGGLFGVGPEAAIALSLIKRARDVVIGLPALLAWQALEGRRAWRRPVRETRS